MALSPIIPAFYYCNVSLSLRFSLPSPFPPSCHSFNHLQCLDEIRDVAQSSRSRLALVWQCSSEADLYGTDEIAEMQVISGKQVRHTGVRDSYDARLFPIRCVLVLCADKSPRPECETIFAVVKGPTLLILDHIMIEGYQTKARVALLSRVWEEGAAVLFMVLYWCT